MPVLETSARFSPVAGGAPLTDQEFELLRTLIQGRSGIALGPQKKEMLRSRLSRRLSELTLSSFTAYIRLLQNGRFGEEWSHCISAVTTSVTHFFREEHHYRYLAEKWLPALRARSARTGNRTLRIWSAGCSTGEEPYTLALVLREALGASARCWDLRILASDIDAAALDRAASGIYPLDRVAAVPRDLLVRYFLKGTGGNSGLVRVRSEIQALVAFRRINLMDDPWPIRTRFDAIFCRNVLIYFDRPTQQRTVKRLAALLKEDGLLFLGHSESLHGLSAPLKHVENTVYHCRTSNAELRMSNSAF